MVLMTSAVTSSSTLWAQASKEWVIPAKPKPGRKPKKDLPPPPSDKDNEVSEFYPLSLSPFPQAVSSPSQTDSKGRRVQNRAAQRAFRERKQSQLADLQARVQSYEQGEMERNVALQNIAKRLKEENESLRKENVSLREELRKLRVEKFPDTERKRWREDSINSYTSTESNSRKRIKTDPLSTLSADAIPASTVSLLPSPSSLASSPGSESVSSAPNDPYSPISFSAHSPNPQAYPQPHQQSQQPMANLFSGYVGKTPGCINENRANFGQSFDMVECGFCSDDMSCMCRDLALQQVAARLVQSEVPCSNTVPHHTSIAPPSPPEVKMESRGSISINSTPQISPATVPMNSIPMNHGSSILDNLPAYAPPVPLPRRRQPQHGPPPSIFPVYPQAEHLRGTRPSSPSCTGDPSNCLACADDPFGKAFCAALGNSVRQCSNCPCIGSTSNFGSGCTGGCGYSSGAPPSNRAAPSSSASGADSQSAASSPGDLSSSSIETMPCNNAWAQLKSHPNIAFADLSMLAEVVARRSKCTGPRVTLTPGPELNGGRQSSQTEARGTDDMPILLTDPHAQYHGRTQQASPNVSPSSSGMSIQCGRQRVVEVQTEGVRDALALLDGQFQHN